MTDMEQFMTDETVDIIKLVEAHITLDSLNRILNNSDIPVSAYGIRMDVKERATLMTFIETFVKRK